MLSQTHLVQTTQLLGILPLPRRNYTPLPSQVIKKAAMHGALMRRPRVRMARVIILPLR